MLIVECQDTRCEFNDGDGECTCDIITISDIGQCKQEQIVEEEK